MWYGFQIGIKGDVRWTLGSYKVVSRSTLIWLRHIPSSIFSTGEFYCIRLLYSQLWRCFSAKFQIKTAKTQVHVCTKLHVRTRISNTEELNSLRNLTRQVRPLYIVGIRKMSRYIWVLFGLKKEFCNARLAWVYEINNVFYIIHLIRYPNSLRRGFVFLSIGQQKL